MFTPDNISATEIKNNMCIHIIKFTSYINRLSKILKILAVPALRFIVRTIVLIKTPFKNQKPLQKCFFVF